MTQTQAVLKWLKTGATISSSEAFKQLGATRLSAIIFNLRHRGYVIDTIKTETTNRYGEKVTYARYKLVSEPTENRSTK